jgi:drug/metabolite transporter (DMT)-like permease
VANVTVIYAMSPLMAALLARFLIGDLLVARTMVAFAVAMVGVVIMVGGSIGTDRLLGDLLALLMSAAFAVVIVEMRRKPEIDNVASSFLSSTLMAALLLPLATLSDITAQDAIVLFLFGFTSNVLGFFMFVAGVRRMPPAEAGLIATVEIVLAPLWVWLLFSENPGGRGAPGRRHRRPRGPLPPLRRALEPHAGAETRRAPAHQRLKAGASSYRYRPSRPASAGG